MCKVALATQKLVFIRQYSEGEYFMGTKKKVSNFIVDLTFCLHEHGTMESCGDTTKMDLFRPYTLPEYIRSSTAT